MVAFHGLGFLFHFIEGSVFLKFLDVAGEISFFVLNFLFFHGSGSTTGGRARLLTRTRRILSRSFNGFPDAFILLLDGIAVKGKSHIHGLETTLTVAIFFILAFPISELISISFRLITIRLLPPAVKVRLVLPGKIAVLFVQWLSLRACEQRLNLRESAGNWLGTVVRGRC